MSDIVIRTEQLTKRFGGVFAVNNCSLHIREKSITGIIGPNGSGKTTLLNLMNGIYEPTSGEVYLRKKRITGYKPYQIARLGIGRTFQNVRIFRALTVLENVIVPTSTSRQDKAQITEKAEKVLGFIGLEKSRNELGANLSGGQQKLLELGRTLMLDPEVILMDEPLIGVHPILKGQLLERLLDLRERMDRSIVLVSHDLQSIMAISDRVLVMNAGSVIADGEPEEVRKDPNVVEAYLGE